MPAGTRRIGSSIRDRHRSWIRNGRKGQKGKYRPMKLHRVAAKKWLQETDNVFRAISFYSGWGDFVPGKEDVWKSWRTRPHIMKCSDLGPDCLSGIMALLYKFKVNMTLVCDWSHGGNCDLAVGLKLCGLWNYWLCLQIAFNACFGWREDERLNQLQDTMRDLYAKGGPKTTPLFMNRARALIEEYRQAGVLFPGVDDPVVELWEHMKKEHPFDHVGQRVQMARWQDSMHAAKRNLQRWERDTFEAEFCALEHDFLGAEKTRRFKLKVAATDDLTEGGHTTSTKVQDFTKKTMRAAGENALAIRLLLYSERKAKRTCAIIFASASPITTWHSNQCRENTSTAGASKWLLDQVLADYMSHVHHCVGQLRNGEVLEKCMFVLSPPQIEKMSEPELGEEDEWADVFGQLCLAMSSARERRGMFLFTWPLKMQRIRGTQEIAQRTCREFREDDLTYMAFKAYGGASVTDKKILQRHCLQLAACDGLRQAFDGVGYEDHRDIREMETNKSRSVNGTRAVEEQVGVAKRLSNLKTCRKFRAPNTAMHGICKSKILSKRHKYDDLRLHTDVGHRDVYLDGDCFKPDHRKQSLPFESVVPTKQATGWWSSTASDLGAPGGDLVLLHTVRHEPNGFDRVRLANNGALMALASRIVIRRKAGSPGFTYAGPWFLPTFHWRDGAVLVKRTVLQNIVGTQWQYIDFDFTVTEPSHAAVTVLGEWEASTYTWRSFAWQRRQFGDEAPRPASIRAFLGEVSDFKKLAAKNAFWKVAAGDVAGAYATEGKALDTSSEFSTLFSAVQGELDTSKADTMEILSQRFARFDEEQEFAAELAEVDEAVQVLEHFDQEKVPEQQRAARTAAESAEALEEEFNDMSETIRAADPNVKNHVGPTSRA